jgi:hypothetical protein
MTKQQKNKRGSIFLLENNVKMRFRFYSIKILDYIRVVQLVH